MTPPPADDEMGKRRALRRMKLQAAALLVVAAGAYAATFAADGGGKGWLGFLRAAAEAGMVGGVADWFAVTALFRRPLGLPIPHTAIIPTRKDAIGRSLQAFIAGNFLSEAVVRERVAAAALPQRVGGWLADPAHARRVADEGATLLAAVVRRLRDEDIEAVLGQAAKRRLSGITVAPWLGRSLRPLVADGAHHGLVDVAVDRLIDWLQSSRDPVVEVIARQAPQWSPRFLDVRIASRAEAEVERVLTEIAADPAHPVRVALDEFLLHLADNLVDDPSTQKRFEALLASLLDRPEVTAAFGDLVGAAKRLLVELVEDADGDLRPRIAQAVMGFGRRLQTDATLQVRLDRAAGDAAGYIASHYGAELAAVIGDTIERWDPADTARRIELQVGRDLQFIRVNGTVVGALVGVVIHAVSVSAL